jgi:hypothetical protein
MKISSSSGSKQETSRGMRKTEHCCQRTVSLHSSIASHVHIIACIGASPDCFCFLLSSLFDAEDGGDVLLRNVWISANYWAFKPRRPYSLSSRISNLEPILLHCMKAKDCSKSWATSSILFQWIVSTLWLYYSILHLHKCYCLHILVFILVYFISWPYCRYPNGQFLWRRNPVFN